MAPHQRLIGDKYDCAITAGVFDLFHQGHDAFFAFMRERAHQVIALVHDDLSTFKNKKRFPAQRHEHRMSNVLHFVDSVGAVHEPDPSDKIRSLVASLRGAAPATRICYIRGDDWLDFPGRDAVERLGLDIIFKPYTEGVSSSRRRKEIEA